MLIDNKFTYEKKHKITLGNVNDSPYYFFDYDERCFDINMAFQHFHTFYEIHIPLDNNVNHIIEGKLYRMSMFDIICLKPYLLHKSEYPKGPSKKRLVIQFSLPADNGIIQRDFEEVLRIFDAPVPIYRFNQKQQDVILHLLNDIYQMSKDNSLISGLTIHNCFISFLCTIYQNYRNNIYEPESLSPAASKIYAVTAYIHEHFGEDLSLAFLAKKFFLSDYYLSHLFKKVTGFTLVNYIQMTRVRNAQQLILFTDKKITDIAYQCGFSSFSQFNRVFNRICMTSPREYKKVQAKQLQPNPKIM
jgi:AraC-like DNA-binding protein